MSMQAATRETIQVPCIASPTKEQIHWMAACLNSVYGFTYALCRQECVNQDLHAPDRVDLVDFIERVVANKTMPEDEQVLNLYCMKASTMREGWHLFRQHPRGVLRPADPILGPEIYNTWFCQGKYPFDREELAAIIAAYYCNAYRNDLIYLDGKAHALSHESLQRQKSPEGVAGQVLYLNPHDVVYLVYSQWVDDLSSQESSYNRREHANSLYLTVAFFEGEIREIRLYDHASSFFLPKVMSQQHFR